MFNKLAALMGLSEKSDDQKEEGAITLQTAFAALLIEAARADENYEEREKDLITALLVRQFSLDTITANRIREEGEAAQADAIDLHRFTREVKTLSEEERVMFIEGLWQIVLSDGIRDPWEDALVRRVCGLIHVTDQQSGKARQRVEAANA